MKRIYGITAVGERVRLEKGVKVISLPPSLPPSIHIYVCVCVYISVPVKGLGFIL
jgi:hypothetical protein